MHVFFEKYHWIIDAKFQSGEEIKLKLLFGIFFEKNINPLHSVDFKI